VRIVLFTGKGGVGKTTAARVRRRSAAPPGTAPWCCRPTRPTRSATPSAVRPVGPEPTEVEPTCGSSRSTRSAASSGPGRDPGLPALGARRAGVDPITAEELTVIPGAEEVLALLELRAHAIGGRWDVIVVD
jgi:arsenite-transporting ATPase